MHPSFYKILAAVKGHMFKPQHFTGNDFSYRFGRIIFRAADKIRTTRRGIKACLRSPSLFARQREFNRHIRSRNWLEALNTARQIASFAEKKSDFKLMEEMGIALSRLSDYKSAAALRLASYRLRHPHDEKEWKGENISGTLLLDLVEGGNQNLASNFMIREASKRAKHCIVLVQPRLLPLFVRTFSDSRINFITEYPKDLAASVSRIAQSAQLSYISTTLENINRSFIPLQTDTIQTSALRIAYKAETSKKVVGISWGSTAYAKDVPSLKYWGDFLRSCDATFVSLQYGEVEHEIASLESSSGRKITNDRSVDQLKDMDRFASQIKALDAVVTISNTGAHLAGALGVPTVILNDDNFRRIWPVNALHAPYYPKTLIVTKNGRDWNEVMKEAIDKLSLVICSKDTKRI